MIRLQVIVEGQTEEELVRQLLVVHLGHFEISTVARRVEVSRDRYRIHRGGVVDYGRVKRDIGRWMKQDQKKESSN